MILSEKDIRSERKCSSSCSSASIGTVRPRGWAVSSATCTPRSEPPPEVEHTEDTGSPLPPRKESRKEPAPKARSHSKELPKAAAAKHAGARSRRR
eukprot:4484468-Prymnesium_polylepis.2